MALISRRSLGPFDESRFARVYAARALSLLGDGLVPVALAFGVLSTDGSPATLGFVLASRFATLAPSLLLGGVIADRYSRKAIMIGSDLVRCGVQVAIAALLISRTAQPGELMLLMGVYGIGEAFFRPSVTGFIPEVVSRKNLQKANALLASTTSVSTIAGPVLAGLLVVSLGPGWAIAADAVTFLVSAGLLLSVPSSGGVTPVSASVLADLAEGWKAFRSRTWLWADGVYSALGNFAVLAPVLAVGPIIAARNLGGAGSWAAVVTCLGIGSVLGGLALLRVHPQRPLLVGVPLLALLALLPALLALPAATPVIGLGALAGGFGLTVSNTLYETTVQQHVEPRVLSRVASIVWLMSLGLSPLGLVTAGLVATTYGVRVPLMAAALWAVASTAAILAVPDVRRLEGRKSVSTENTTGPHPHK